MLKNVAPSCTDYRMSTEDADKIAEAFDTLDRKHNFQGNCRAADAPESLITLNNQWCWEHDQRRGHCSECPGCQACEEGK